MPDAIGILGYDGTLRSRAVHPFGVWIGGWNLNPERHQIRGIGDLDGDSRAEFLITSDWGIGVMEHSTGAFRLPFGAPRDTVFGGYTWDDTSMEGRDRIMGVEHFTGGLRPEALVWNRGAMATLEFTAAALSSTRIHPNGTRLGGWVLSTVDNHYWGLGRFGGGARAMVLTSPWGIGLVDLGAGTDLFMAPNGTRLGDWIVNTEGDRVRLIADLDGDGEDEILITNRNSMGVLKLLGTGLETIAFHRTGTNLGGYRFDGISFNVIADQFAPGGPDEVLISDFRGFHLLRLNVDRLERRAAVDNLVRVDGWVVDTPNNTIMRTGDLTGDGRADFLVRSPWGIGVMSIDPSNNFRCPTLHAHGSLLGAWDLESSDVIAGVGMFTGGEQNELLVMKPSAEFQESPSVVSGEFRNWHGNIRQTLRTVQPRSLTELVSAVRDISDANENAGVAGSGWSFTNCVVDGRTDVLIDTSQLNSVLPNLVPDIIDDRAETVGNRFVHVEGGIKLFDLNCQLDAMGLALPTLGGSRGQSLAGVLGTGTHGADVDLPPIADAVRAIHLVGPGGQQWWIEPNFHAITTRQMLDDARAQGLIDPTTKNVYDDEWFNSVLVSMGCAGVIYSVIVECVPAFRLESTTIAESWTNAQTRIQNLLTAAPSPRFLEINVNPVDLSCRTVERNITTLPDSMPTGGGPDMGAVLAGLGIIGPGALGFFFGAIGDYIARTTAEIALLAAIPIVGPVLAAKKTVEALEPVQDLHQLLIDLNLAAVHPHDDRRIAELVPTLINVLWRIGAFIIDGRTLVDQIQSALTDMERPVGTIVGPSFQVSTVQPPCTMDGSQNHAETDRLVESFDYAVSTSRAIEFVDRLVEAIRDARDRSQAIIVNLNLRFTSRTRATMGMSKFESTCHVELFTFRGIRGNRDFKRDLEDVISDFDAVPHWGQFHEPEEADVFRTMGAQPRWRNVMRLIADGNEMFWSDFARDRDLLP
ncbi:MAG: FAD-binding protein [Myxococcota bacterium]